MSLQKQLDYNKGLFMYRVLSSEAPKYKPIFYFMSVHVEVILEKKKEKKETKTYNYYL